MDAPALITKRLLTACASDRSGDRPVSGVEVYWKSSDRRIGSWPGGSMRRFVKLLGALLSVVAMSSAQTAQQAETATASDDRFFVDKLYPVLEAAECRMCHNDNGVASATRVHFPAADATPDAIRAFGLGLWALVDRANPDASLLLRKPTARVAHGGGERIKKGTPQEAVLQSW